MMNHPIEHQEKDTECGMYSLCFIIKMLQGTNYKNLFLNKKILFVIKKCLLCVKNIFLLIF